MYPSFWAQFHDFFETALYWFASTFNLTAEFAKIRGALEEFFWAMESIFEGLFTTFLRFSPADFLVTKKQKHLLRVLLFLITRTLN